jgi:hypothetical protein
VQYARHRPVIAAAVLQQFLLRIEIGMPRAHVALAVVVERVSTCSSGMVPPSGRVDAIVF